MNDEIIINEFSDKRGKINPNKTTLVWLDKHEEIKKYLENRYPDDEFISYLFTLQRIFNHIDELPRCKHCGKKIYKINGKWCDVKCQLTDKNFIKDRESKIDKHESYIKGKQTKLERYGDENYNNKEKTKETCLRKYGVEHYINYEKRVKTNLERYGYETCLKNEEVINKGKKTKLERYGDENYKNPEKVKQTIKERYGIENWMASSEFRKKSKQTKLKLYGDENFTNKEKYKQTSLKKFGVDNWGKTQESIEITHTPEVNKKRIETKRKNHTFNTSKIEIDSYNLLRTKYVDTIYQYKSNEYPYSCDFYIPSLKLYIECNYHWTHGGHPFNEFDDNDIKLLNKWKEKHTKYYDNAIQCWTIRDINKRNTAIKNNLNYIEFWNLNELKNWIENN